MLSTLIAVAVSANPPRFDLATPLPGIPGVRIDAIGTGVGVAQQTARSRGLQARILWVDTTANISRYNTDEKVDALVARAKEIGFNAIAFDIKPIIGYPIFPTRLERQLTTWRDQTLPEGYDPLAAFVRSSRQHGIKLFVSLNAFSEGHRLAHEQAGRADSPFMAGLPGPGYSWPERQSVQVDFAPVLEVGDRRWRLSPTVNERAPGAEATLLGRPAVRPGEGFAVRAGFVASRFEPGDRVVALHVGANPPPGAPVRITAEPTFRRASERQNQIPLMMNPFHPDNEARMIAFVREVLSRYEVDGLLFDDRLRFTGADGDFSELTRGQFEKRVGTPLRWPDDIFTQTFNWDLRRGTRPGRFWDAWWSFRAEHMRGFMTRVRSVVKATRPQAMFGIYAGAWYGEYDTYGANYGAPGLRAGFPFLTRSFARQGFADQLDLFVAGCYYRVPTIYDAMVAGLPEGRTVEAGAQLANRVVDDRAWTVAGIMLQDFFSNPPEVEGALQAAVASSQGVMVFDLSHRFDTFEPFLRRGFSRRATFPSLDVLREVHKLRRAREAAGWTPPPIFIYPGAPGVGH